MLENVVGLGEKCSQSSLQQVCSDSLKGCATRILRKFWPVTCRTKLKRLKFVRHVVGHNFHKHSCCTSLKVSPHTGDVSLQHFFPKCPRSPFYLCTSCVSVLAICPLVCTTRVFCRCVMSLHHVPSCTGSLIR